MHKKRKNKPRFLIQNVSNKPKIGGKGISVTTSIDDTTILNEMHENTRTKEINNGGRKRGELPKNRLDTSIQTNKPRTRDPARRILELRNLKNITDATILHTNPISKKENTGPITQKNYQTDFGSRAGPVLVDDFVNVQSNILDKDISST